MDTPDFSTVLHLSPEVLLQHPGLIHSVIEHASTALIMSDAEGRCLYMNPAAQQITGFPFSELKGRILHEALHYMHPDGSPYPQTQCPIWKTIQAASPLREQEEFLVHKDKSIYPVKYSITPILDQNKVIAVLHEIRDISEERRALAELTEAEKRFDEVVNDASLLFAVWDQNANLTFISQPWLEYTGVSREYAFKTGLLDRFHPDTQEDVVVEWRNAFVRRERFSGEYRIQRSDGEYRWFYMVTTPRYTAHHFSGFYATAVDIHDKKEAELALIASQEKFRQLYDSNMVGVIFWDLFGRISEANDAFLEIVGYTRDEFNEKGLNWRELTPPEYKALDENAIEQLDNTGVSKDWEKQYFHKDGHRIDILIRAAYLKGSQYKGVAYLQDITARKSVERALLESEQRFKNVADSAPVMIWMVDLTGRIQFWNKSWLEFTGLSEADALGMDWLQLFHTDERETLVAQFQDAIAQQTSFTKEVRLFSRLGEVKWGLITAKPYHSVLGVVGYIGTLVDITERKEAERLLQKREEYFRDMANLAPAMIWLATPDGRVSFINQGLQTFLGLSWEEKMPEKFVGEQRQQVIHPDDWEQYYQNWQRFFANREIFSQEFRVRNFQGEYRWILESGHPRYDSQGVYVGYIGSLLDITERKEVEIALQKREEYFRDMANLAPAMIWLADPDGQLSFVNEGVLSYFGYTLEQLLDESIRIQFIHPDMRDTYLETWHHFFEVRKEFTQEVLIRNAQGGYRWILETGRPRYGSQGEYVGFIGSLLDITDRKEVEIALQKSEAYFRYIADTSPVMLWMATIEGNNEFVSEGLADYFGLKKEDFNGLTWLEAFHPEEREFLRTTYFNALHTKTPYTVEVRARTKNGDYRWILDSGQPRFDEKGNLIGFIGTVVDIHDRKEAVLALERSEEYFRYIVDIAPVMLWMSDNTGAISFLSQEIVNSFGGSKEDYLGDRWLQQVHPEERDQMFSEYLSQVQKQEGYSPEFRFKNKEGEYRWVLGACQPRFSLTGAFEGFIGILTDITEKKEAEISIRASEAQLQTIVDLAPVMLWITDKKRRIIYSSERLREFLGIEVIGSDPKLQAWRRFIHPDDLSDFIQFREAQFENRQTYQTEVRMLNVEGQYRWILIAINPRLSEAGEFLGNVGSAIDITEKKEAEIVIQESEAQLRTVVGVAPVMLWITDNKRKIIYTSQRFHDFFGADLVGCNVQSKEWLDLIHPDDLSDFLQGREEHFEKRQAFRAEIRMRNSDDQYRWVLVGINPRLSEAGEFLGNVGSAIDITEKKEIELAIQESEAQLHMIVSIAPVMLWVTNEKRKVAYVSQHFRDFFGIDLVGHDILSKEWQGVIHPEDLSGFIQDLVEQFEKRQPYRTEIRMRNVEGQYRWILFGVNPWISEAGEFLGNVGSAIDITEKKEVEIAIQESELFFRNLADSTAVMMSMSDLDGQVYFFNKSFLEFTGRSEVDMLGSGWTQIVHPDDLEPYTTMRLSHIKKLEAYSGELRFKNKEGDYRWCLTTAQPFTREGKIAGFIASVFDIHERKKAELAIQESEAFFRSLANSTPVMIGMSDQNGVGYFLNQSCMDFTGLSEAEIISRGWEGMLHPDDVERYIKERQQHIEKREAYEGEFRLRNREGQYRWCLGTARPFTHEGKFAGFIGSIVDIHERKEAEIKIHESEEFFRTIANSTPSIIFMSDSKGDITFVNQSWLNFTGVVSEKEALGAEWEKLIYPEDAERYLKDRQMKIAKREPFEGELRYKYHQKQYRWIWVSAQPRYTLEGEFAGYVGAFVDIHDRKEAELKIIESEQLFRTVADSTPVMLWMTDKEGVVTFFNKSWLDFAGFSEEKALGSGWIQTIHPDDTDHYLKERTVYIEQRIAHEAELRVRNREGQYRWVLALNHPRYTADGELAGFVGALIDIHERKEAELKLQESERRFRLMADSAPVMIWVTEPHCEVSYFNDEFLSFLGMSLEEASGQGYFQRVHPDDQPIVVKIMEEMDQHPHIVNFQIRFFSPRHNEFRWISATETPRYKEDGSYAGCIGAAVDITDFKRAQEAIQDYTKRLEQSNKDLEQFATIASHDLQAPLRKIAMFSSYIQETSYNALTNESKDYFDRILKSVEKMQRLLKDLLDLSRVTRKGQPFRPVRLNTIVDEVISDLQFLMLETNGRLEVDELCTVQADPLQMHQLFQNLLGNALKFHQPHLPPLVKIYLEESRDAYCSIVVEDNGIGFKEEQAERIFEPFVRLNGAEAYEGTGMGLTICKKIVERHGGRISITSRLGEGTRVLIRLLKADTTNGTH